MENASKALIIAGAILLSIIIISLGIMVVNNARTQIGGANLSKEQIQTFNSQWENYIGTGKSAAEVRAMYSAVMSSNAAETQSGEKRYIQVTNTGIAKTAVITSAPSMTTLPAITSSATYTIKAGYGSNGLIVGLDYK